MSTHILSGLSSGKDLQGNTAKHESQFSSSSSSTLLQRVVNKNPTSPLACPECRQQTNTFDIESLPKNVFLIRLLDQLKQTSNGTTCGNQENSTPTTTTKAISSDHEKKQCPVNKTQSDSKQLQPSVPYAKALFDFHMAPMDDEGCLKFQKGMIIQVTRRVDQNWAEGKLGETVGIFPLSFVNMNQAANSLMQSYATKWRLPASMPPTTTINTATDQSPSTSTSLQRPIQHQPPLQPMPVQPILIRPTSPPSSSQNVMTTNGASHISQDKTGVYIALHNYMPQKQDELELKKGSQYVVNEACQDGWFKGVCSDNLFKKGVFPGNYVMPLLYHQKMIAMQRSAALQAHKNHANSNTQQMRTTGAYTNLGLSSIPPELPQRNLTTTRPSQSQVNQSNKSEAAGENSPNAHTQKTDDNVNKLKKESMTDMLMKKLGYNRKSNDSSAYSMDNPVFEDSSPASSKAKTTPPQPNHMRSGSCPINLGLTNVNVENLQFGSQRVKTRERSALPM